MSAYYNEIDPGAAEWLRELIKNGHIAPGEVDERSILDIRPDELRGFTQCHFFAGIGVWSYALRRAGWDDDRPVWTGSCPCQPFSAAGKGGGFDDERHLWPAFDYLIQALAPGVVFGEQVASKDGFAWLDLVQTDMEGKGYTFGAVDLCAAGFGAPHIRQRLYWVGDTGGERRQQITRSAPSNEGTDGRRQEGNHVVAGYGEDGDMDNTSGPRCHAKGEWPNIREERGRKCLSCERCEPSDMGDTGCQNGEGRRMFEPGRSDQTDGARQRHDFGIPGTSSRLANSISVGRRGWRDGDSPRLCRQIQADGPGPVNGFWSDAEWIYCRDEKWRPTEPGSFPLAYGSPERVGRLRGYGNCIVAPVAQAFIESYMEAT